LEKGIKKFKEFSLNKILSGKEAFLLCQSYGFPPEMIEEECKKMKIKFNKEDFAKEQCKHQELSRTATQGKFKSGLADNSEQTTKLHTATHLLLEALRIVLNNRNIMQKGSNITPERLRVDFNFPRQLTKEEIEKVEDLVNAEIQKECEVTRLEMSPQEAKKKGAIGVFDSKYGEKVSVYSVGDFSKEICAGPHVKNTCEIGHFKIIKEESSSSGVRRIKATVN
jgi:alanyl-tRNA synthetase